VDWSWIGIKTAINATARMGMNGSTKRRKRRVVDVIVNIVCVCVGEGGGAWVGCGGGWEEEEEEEEVVVVGGWGEVEGWVDRIMARRIVCGIRRIKRGK
jgi:hypothetical protein